MDTHRVVLRDEWLQERVALLEAEKAYTRARDDLRQRRLSLPWVRVEKEYTFQSPSGSVSLKDLFDGRSQLYVKHFMLGPGQKQLCVGCSLEADHVQGLLVHLQNHDVSYVAVARAPIEEIELIRKRMAWTFPWVSSFENDFSYDFHVSFRPEEMEARSGYYNYGPIEPPLPDLSGNSAFYKDENGEVYHTYSRYARGGEDSLGIYGILDVMPKGRNETGPNFSLTDWARPHDMYGQEGRVEANGRYHPAACCQG